MLSIIKLFNIFLVRAACVPRLRSNPNRAARAADPFCPGFAAPGGAAGGALLAAPFDSSSAAVFLRARVRTPLAAWSRGPHNSPAPSFPFPPLPSARAEMSRSDRIVNILLALAWVLLIVRVGRIYFDTTAPATSLTGSGADSFDDVAPSPIVLVRAPQGSLLGGRGPPVCRPQCGGREARAPFARAPRLVAAHTRPPPRARRPPPSAPAAHAHLDHGPAGAAAHCGEVPLFSRHGRLAKV